MLHRAFQHVGHRLDAAVRVHWKAWVFSFEGIIEGKVVKQEEWIERVSPGGAKRAT